VDLTKFLGWKGTPVTQHYWIGSEELLLLDYAF